jgi:regulator of replication initiation timing
MPHSHGIESLSEDQITGMQAEIERLREQLGRKNSEVKELEDLRIENALLKAKVESLEAASVKEGEPNTGSSP